MKKSLVVFAALSLMLSLIILTGCATAVRYSETEIQGFPSNIQDNIRKGEVALGMTPEQVRYSWGNPDYQKILDPYEGKTRGEWMYAKLGVFGTRLLFFYEGKLIYVK